MRATHWLRTSAAVAGLALVVAACGGGNGDEGTTGGGGGGGEGGDGVLKFGYVLPETGQLAFLGPPQVQAAKYAISQINEAGGVLGEQIPDIVAGDEAGDQAVANQSADRVLNQNVDAIIGAAASGMSLAIIDKVTGANVVQCSGSNTAPTFTDYDDGGYYFRTAPSDALQGPVLADVIAGDGHSNLAIVARADDYGKGLAQATAKAFEGQGGSIAVNTTYDPAATNFDAAVQQVVNAKPDAVAVIAFEEGKQIIQGLIEAGMGPDKIGVYGADGLRSAELGKLVSPNNPAIIAGMKGTAPASAENKEFVDALKAFAPDLKELQFAPQVYDCVNIIALAAVAAETDDASKFKDEIVGVTKDGEKCNNFKDCAALLKDGKDIDYDGVSGPLEFVDAGEPGSAQIEVYEYDSAGALQSVRTVESKPAS